ncbi:dihydrodipicolinate synthase family protein [Janibacter hoylei]|uniref:dihydrodipicolinate synthase family protein n=1 Tax=Janibacter hoylei TaxID=364298 RepID=UPI0021A753A5|nr:dihydrodipicolinate synthase family protein [Janibacter hoylei]MCT2293507.1 dihydrodipicolinate synthase family protein [Janibacter hoylei]
MTTAPGLRGLSAFPLTPIAQDAVDEAAFVGIVERVATAGVDSITALGSTGSYAYLDRGERRRVVELAVAAAGDVPVLAGIGHVRTREVLRHAEDAQAAGASGLLLAPVTYQALTDDEVFQLFADVDAAVSVPVVVYDNPGTTHVAFSDELHARISRLAHVAAIKIPPVTGGVDVVRARVDSLRSAIAADVRIGISGDQAAADALVAGCDAWYSVLAGTLPGPCRAIVDAVADDDATRAQRLSHQLDPLWRLFSAHGSYRVVSALAEQLGLVRGPNLPRPVLPLDERGRADVRAALTSLRDEGLVEP